MTLDLILKTLLTAIFGYYTINTFLKFHFSMDRIVALFIVLVVAISLFFLGSTLYFECALAMGITLLLSVVLKVICIKKKRYSYFLFNTFKNQYDSISKDLIELADEFLVSRKKINYNSRKPWLVVIKDVELKKTNKFIKKLDDIYTHKPKKLSMYNYWTAIVFFTLMAALWRFL